MYVFLVEKPTKANTDLSKDERLFIVDGIESVVRDGACPELLAYCVGR